MGHNMGIINEKTSGEGAQESIVQSMSNWVSNSFNSIKDYVDISNMERISSSSSPTELYHYIVDEELKNESSATFEKYLSLLPHGRDQTFTAIIIPNVAEEQLVNTNNKSSLLSVNTKAFKKNKQKVIKYGKISNLLQTQAGAIGDIETFKEFVYTLTFPTLDKATLSRQFAFAKEPIPAGESISEFMMRGNLHLILEGTISNIQSLKKNFNNKPQIKTSALSVIADGVTNMLWNKYGSALKEKCFKLLNSSAVTEKMLGAYNLVSEYNRRFGITNTLSNALNRNIEEDNSPKAYNGYTKCQYFIEHFNKLYGQKGALMKVYFMGVEYENMALIDIKVNSTPKSLNSMHVSLHFEQQQLVRKRIVSKASGGNKTPSKGKTTPKTTFYTQNFK